MSTDGSLRKAKEAFEQADGTSYEQAANLTIQNCRKINQSINLRLLARDVIGLYTSPAYATMSVSVCLSVCSSVCDGSALAHYSYNLGFKFRSKFAAHCGRGEG